MPGVYVQENRPRYGRRLGVFVYGADADALETAALAAGRDCFGGDAALEIANRDCYYVSTGKPGDLEMRFAAHLTVAEALTPADGSGFGGFSGDVLGPQDSLVAPLAARPEAD
jgi:hypothetical protein